MQSATVTDAFVQVRFWDNPGTTKRMTAFLEMFCAAMQRYGISGQDVCGCCGDGFDCEPAADVQVGGIVCRMHEACAAQLSRQMQEDFNAKSQPGSVAKGSLGALIGAVLGAIP